ncbi:unnamed protein product [Camellia sinensis]
MKEDHTTHIFGLPPFLVAVMGITAAAITLLTYHCIVARWCNHHREFIPQWPRPPRTNHNEDILSSIETSITEFIPSYKYNKDIGMVSKTQDKTCAVCLCEFMDGEPVRVLPECLHSFHVPCIDMWLYSHSNCPVCRADATPARLPLSGLPGVDAVRVPPVEAV